MTVRVVSESSKDLIVDWFVDKIYDKNQLAEKFNVSTRTIDRVLMERGINHRIHPVNEDRKILRVVQSYDLNAKTLREALERVPFNLDNLYTFLTDIPDAQAAEILHNVALVRAYRKAEAHADKVMEEASAKDTEQS